MRLVAIALVSMLAGCASLTQPDNELRVTEYSGGVEGTYAFMVGGQVQIEGGCRVVQVGTVDACVLYQGERCMVRSARCEVTE